MLKKILIFCFVSILLSGCADKNTAEKISFATWGSATEIKILKGLISDFETENPNIKIELMHIPQNYFQKIHLLFASNTAPDVIFINNLYLPVYSDFLYPLNSEVDSSAFYKEAVEALSQNNNIYAIPRDISSLIFYVNLNLTGMPAKNWTLNDLVETGLRLKEKGLYGVSFDDKIYLIQPYLRYFGGGILNNNNDLIIDSQESSKALAFYKSLVCEYKIAPSKSDAGSYTQAQLFLDGKTGFYLSGRWMYPKIKETANFKWGVINFPYGKSPQPLDSSGWAVSLSSKHKASAIKFVNYISGEKCAKRFTETGLIVPARVSVSKYLNNSEHNEKVFLEVIEHSEKTPVTKNYGKIVDQINNSLDL